MYGRLSWTMLFCRIVSLHSTINSDIDDARENGLRNAHKKIASLARFARDRRKAEKLIAIVRRIRNENERYRRVGPPSWKDHEEAAGEFATVWFRP